MVGRVEAAGFCGTGGGRPRSDRGLNCAGRSHRRPKGIPWTIATTDGIIFDKLYLS